MQATGILADHLKGVGSEVIDDLFGVRFADAVDQAATQVFADAVDRGGKLRLELRDFKLIAVLGVACPLTVKLKSFPALHSGKGTQDGDGALAVGHLHLGHAIGVFFIEVDDSFENAGDGLVVLYGWWHRGRRDYLSKFRT